MTGHTNMQTFTTRSPASSATRAYSTSSILPAGTLEARSGQSLLSHSHARPSRHSEMFRYDLTGYSYGIGRPISFTWVGYLYKAIAD